MSFPAREAAELGIPEGLVEPRSPGHLAMRRKAGRCIAFEGDVGRSTGCGIYGCRPVPCREFEPSRDAEMNPYCDQARAAFGLPPLR